MRIKRKRALCTEEIREAQERWVRRAEEKNSARYRDTRVEIGRK